MTRERSFGSDVPFCRWMREQKELPSDSKDCGFVATDVDLMVHRYRTSINGVGTREFQKIMHIEIKTRQGLPSESQMDTLSKLNLFSGSREDSEGHHIRHYGVFVLVLTATCPNSSSKMWWGYIPRKRIVRDARDGLCWRRISKPRLIKLLKFEIHPRTFKNMQRRGCDIT